MNASAASPGSSTAIAAAPAESPGHQSSHDSGVSYTTTRAHEIRPAGGESERDVATEAVTEHDGRLRCCATSSASRSSMFASTVHGGPTCGRSAVAAPVVADHPVVGVETPAQPEQAGRPVHRSVHHDDERRRRIARRSDHTPAAISRR